MKVDSLGVRMSEVFFNAPPNWPLSDEFEPTPSWQPEPQWGPPPPGWSIWIDEYGQPASPDGPLMPPPQLQQRPTVQTLPAEAHAAAHGYWRMLLVWGFGLCIVSGVLLAVLNSQSSENASSTDGLGALVVISAFLGSVLLIPGMIGWGIEASGIKQSLHR